MYLKGHLENAAGNALYTSKTVLMGISGDPIRAKLLKKVQEAVFYSVIADEAADAANDEQLSICLGFVSGNLPCEKFLAFHECQSGITGFAISEYILSKLSEWQLQPQFLCGQAYDGARTMAGKSKEVSACIQSKYPKALYTQCASHWLNLGVTKSCLICEVSNMMQTRSCASSATLLSGNFTKKKWIGSTLPDEKQRKIKELCKSHWVKPHEAFEVFCDSFLPALCCFEAIIYSSSSD